MDRDVELAPVDALDREPVDELRVGLAADPRQQRDPGGERFAPPREAADRSFHPRPRLRVEPVGRVLDHRFEPPRQRRERLLQRLERLQRRRGIGTSAPSGSASSVSSP